MAAVQQGERRLERARPELGVGRGDLALGPACRVRGQLGRLVEEGGLGCRSAARLRPARRALELFGDRLVGADRRTRAMPGAAIGIERAVGDLGERTMHGLALAGRGGAIDGRPHERVREAHAMVELEQLGRGRGVSRLDRDLEPLGPAPHQHRIADRLRRREQQEPLRVGGQGLHAPFEALLDAPLQRMRVRQAEPAGELGRRHAARQLQQGERIAARLGDDPVAHALVQRAAHGRRQQGPGIHGSQAADRQLRQPHRFAVGAEIAAREDQGDRFREQSPRDERQRLLGGLVEPLGVVDHADERSLLGDVGEQAQHRQPDEEAIRRVAGAQPERRAQRVALRAGERVELPEQRRAQLMQARERDLHLRLDAAGAHDPAPRRALCDVAQEGRLADAGLPMQDQRAALAAARRVQQPVERVAFASTAQQRRRTPRHHTQRAYILCTGRR